MCEARLGALIPLDDAAVRALRAGVLNKTEIQSLILPGRSAMGLPRAANQVRFAPFTGRAHP